MLTRLSVTNFAIIDKLNLGFNQGLTIITGETGTGKSILLGALRLILGERADLKQLSDPEKKCVVEAVFNISKLKLESFFEENELDFENETILRRELLPGGKSRAFINDTPVNLSTLHELGEKLIDIHSQFNTQNLFDQAYQLQLLDAYAGQLAKIWDYKELLLFRNQKRSALKDAEQELEQISKEADYKQFLLEELKELRLKENELETLEKEQNELQHTEEIRQILDEAEQRLDDSEFSIIGQLNPLIAQLQKISEYGSAFEEFYTRIESARIELSDLASEISTKLRNLESDPQRLSEVSDRLDLINNLLNKHRLNTCDELIELTNRLETEKNDSEQLELEIEKLKTEVSKLDKQLDEKADEISKTRKSVVPALEKEILSAVSGLGMENASIDLKLNTKNNFGPTGKDEIEFLFSANKGSAPKPIEKSVSGGERSRLMLSVKKILAGKLELPTLILDEIDTGVSGKVADEVGNMMKEMANDIQLITITHLPQVAAKGNTHLKVSKKTDAEKTITQVEQLDKNQRIREIATMISGSDISDTALKQAELLLNA